MRGGFYTKLHKNRKREKELTMAHKAAAIREQLKSRRAQKQLQKAARTQFPTPQKPSSKKEAYAKRAQLQEELQQKTQQQLNCMALQTNHTSASLHKAVTKKLQKITNHYAKPHRSNPRPLASKQGTSRRKALRDITKQRTTNHQHSASRAAHKAALRALRLPTIIEDNGQTGSPRLQTAF